MPITMKVFFVIMVILVLLSLFYFGKDSYFIFGLSVKGVPAKIIYVLLDLITPTLLLVAMLKRYGWTFKYAICYLGFFTLNSLVGIIIYTRLIPEDLFKYMWPAIAIGVLPIIILVIFLILFWRAKNYFNGFVALVLSLSIGTVGFSSWQAPIANADQCDNSAATSEYNGCKSGASQEKNSCVQGCTFYMEDPCFGECQSNYNQCTGICNDVYNSTVGTCSDIFADSSVQCVNEEKSGDTEPEPNTDTPKKPQPKSCSAQENNFNAARKKVQDACNGIEYPERLLTTKGREPNDLMPPLCKTLKENMDKDQATLDRAQKLLDWDKSQKKFFENTVIPNQKGEFADLLDEYENLQHDILEKEVKLDEASEKFSEIKHEANIAWAEAVVGMSGPAGVFGDVGILIGKSLAGAPKKHIGIRVAIDAAEYPLEKVLKRGLGHVIEGAGKAATPVVAIAGAVWDGLELQELAVKTKEAEREYKQKLGWYNDALTAMNGFKSRQDYATLMGIEKKMEGTRHQIRLLDIEIDGLEKEIPVMKHTLGISKELSDKCEKDLKEETDAIEQQDRCRAALLEEKTAKNDLSTCEAAK